MCGIGGVYCFNDVNKPDLEFAARQMQSDINVRGPDGNGISELANGSGFFIHSRLAIIGLDKNADQPMHYSKKRYHITYNGEVYNYKELKNHLQADGWIFKTNSDTEVLLALYAKYGKKMVRMLRGMFAFAIFDRFDRKLTVIRDPFGIKPLYFSKIKRDYFVFSSSQVSISNSGLLRSRTKNAGAEVAYYISGHVPQSWTMLEEINALDPGTILEVYPDGKIIEENYFNLANAIKCDKKVNVEDFQQKLFDTVKSHMVADVEVCAFLSGGIDSSVIACLASEVGLEKSITIGFDDFKGTTKDEVVLANKLSKTLGLDSKFKYFDRQNLESEKEHFLQQMESPTVDGFNSFLASKFATENSVKVSISGVGADEFFGGYNTFKSVPILNKINFLGGTIPGTLLRKILEKPAQHFGKSKLSAFFEMSSSFVSSFIWRKCVFFPWELFELMDADEARDGIERYFNYLNYKESQMAGMDNFQKIVFLETSLYLIPQLLRDIDWASMANGLEVRTPFVDIEIFNYLCRENFTLRKTALVPEKYQQILGPRLKNQKMGFEVPSLFHPKFLGVQKTSYPRETRKLDWSKYVLRTYKEKMKID